MTAIPTPARLLGFGGLIPFVVTAVSVLTLSDNGQLMALDIMLHYSAVILSFLGAVHWGAGLTSFTEQYVSQSDNWIRIGWSVTPALVAWLAIQMTLLPSLITFILGFAGAFIFDAWSGKKGWLPSWYIKLRKSLSLIVLICLALVFVEIRF